MFGYVLLCCCWGVQTQSLFLSGREILPCCMFTFICAFWFLICTATCAHIHSTLVVKPYRNTKCAWLGNPVSIITLLLMLWHEIVCCSLPRFAVLCILVILTLSLFLSLFCIFDLFVFIADSIFRVFWGAILDIPVHNCDGTDCLVSQLCNRVYWWDRKKWLHMCCKLFEQVCQIILVMGHI